MGTMRSFEGVCRYRRRGKLRIEGEDVVANKLMKQCFGSASGQMDIRTDRGKNRKKCHGCV